MNADLFALLLFAALLFVVVGLSYALCLSLCWLWLDSTSPLVRWWRGLWNRQHRAQ